MPFTYTPANAIELVQAYTKSVPISAANAARICDEISAQMYTEFPWHWTLSNIGPPIVLLNGVQDYNSPNFIYRLVRARIVQVDLTPTQYREMDVVNYLAPDLTQGGLYSIRACALEEALGMIRLSLAAQVSAPSGTLLIQSSTNASPIVLTVPNHGFGTTTPAQTVKVDGHLVNTAANGIWEIVVVNSNQISLTGSTGNGVGAATGTVVNAMLRLHGEFQRQHDKITENNMGQALWFPDYYFPVFVEGVKWKVYQMMDDSRAGGLVIDRRGNRNYSGQMGVFLDALTSMKEAEDAGNGQPFMFPDDPLGYNQTLNPGLFGWSN